MSHYNESEGKFGMRAPRYPLLSGTVSPLFVITCDTASTFHARKGLPASTQKYALSLRGVPSFSLDFDN